MNELKKSVQKKTGRATIDLPKGRSRAKVDARYYIVQLKAKGAWADRLYVSHIVRAVSEEEAIGYICEGVKRSFPAFSMQSKDIVCERFKLKEAKFSKFYDYE